MPSEPDLEIGNNDRFHRSEWYVQRVGWVAIALILLAALFGLLGSSYFGQRQAVSADGRLQIEYPRYTRFGAQARLTVGVLADGPALRIWLPVAYLERMHLQRVEPEPVRVTAAGDVRIFTFAIAPAPAARVVFQFKPETPGRVRGGIGVVDGPELAFRQFVYP